MARIAFSATLGPTTGNGRYYVKPGRGSEPSDATAAVVAAAVAVTADIATLVADGASPTQAHVTTLNGHYTTLAAAITAANASAGSADVIVSVDTSTVPTRNQLRAALEALLRLAQGDGSLTG